jgi:2-polyprenyl-6-methoxyphenol hydroxylase-like FAD-dependent oxidoreductase
MKIAIVGLGYVGLPLALAFAEKGVEVLGIDTDPSKVMLLEPDLPRGVGQIHRCREGGAGIKLGAALRYRSDHSRRLRQISTAAEGKMS